MNILVTGGTGFIGEHFIPKLLDDGHKVRLLVRDIIKAKNKFGDSCEYFVGDVTKKGELKGCCDGIEVVFHMVAKVGNQLPSKESFKSFREVNVEGTKNIISECRNIKRFIFVSSIAAMGISKELPITENSNCAPYLPYQVTKYEAERAVLDSIKDGLPAIIIRPTKVYGVGEHEYSYLTLAKLCYKGIFIKVGTGHNYTSNIYITDFVQALVSLVDRGKIGEVYIVSSEESIDFIAVGRLISNVLGKKIIVISIPVALMIMAASIEEGVFNFIHRKPIVTKQNIKATTSDRVYDISKAKADLDYTPQISMTEGIVRTIEWYKKMGMI